MCEAVINTTESEEAPGGEEECMQLVYYRKGGGMGMAIKCYTL